MVYHTHIILNALLECVLLAHTHCILSYLKCFIYLNFLLTVCLFFTTGTAAYILYNFTCNFNTKKQLLINARMK